MRTALKRLAAAAIALFTVTSTNAAVVILDFEGFAPYPAACDVAI